MIKNGNGSNILILGATPELRILALKHDCRVTAVDTNMIIINAMYEFMDYTQVDESKEIIVKSNWLNMPLKRHSYDLILGDGSFNELTIDNYENLMVKLKQLLKPHGYVSTKIIFAPPNRKSVSMLDVFREYSQKPPEEKTNIFSDLLNYLIYSLEVYDPKSYESSSQKWWKQLQRLDEEQKIEKTGFEVLFDFCKFCAEWGYRCTIPKRLVVEKLLNKYFTIVSKRSCEEPWLMDAHLYLLRSK
jgi:hypothetical protein